jgi:hypothetical protein
MLCNPIVSGVLAIFHLFSVLAATFDAALPTHSIAYKRTYTLVFNYIFLLFKIGTLIALLIEPEIHYPMKPVFLGFKTNNT